MNLASSLGGVSMECFALAAVCEHLHDIFDNDRCYVETGCLSIV